MPNLLLLPLLTYLQFFFFYKKKEFISKAKRTRQQKGDKQSPNQQAEEGQKERAGPQKGHPYSQHTKQLNTPRYKYPSPEQGPHWEWPHNPCISWPRKQPTPSPFYRPDKLAPNDP